MKSWIGLCWAFLFSLQANAAESLVLPIESGEEVAVNIYPPTFSDSEKPLLIWFTEGYAHRKTFKEQLTRFNDVGYEIWQVDLLESYFLERTPVNIRGLSGAGVAAVLVYANQTDRPFVVISSGRMNLAMFRGVRLWQLEHQPDRGIGKLQQVLSFFPNIYDVAKKAGDTPELFPIVSASSLPITIIQPTEGAFKWKLAETITALEKHHSQVALVAVANARDWYFVKNDGTELERKAANDIADLLAIWLKAGKVSEDRVFVPVEKLASKQATVRAKGLVEVRARPSLDFALKDINGKAVQFKDKQGKVILLNFWASWCGPCVKEIPSMNRLAQSFSEDKFEIVSLNFRETPQTIKDFMQQVQVDFPVLMDLDGKVSDAYQIFAFPSSFLLDAKGNIRYSVNTAIEWDEAEVKAVIEALIED
ncbi:TlpA family protein disulfide reductase [Thiomicrorhabdus sediminis]|uniref:TlpA family protein disulfide reductase n=1 Tax=Thiomicrorhabdus sediminis TaxID=2580412 RepID=A0A4P9K506_9GAMM|nr:TlpA disulfide reductase family protein [Thiomicrorhabdus sediminis]QCU90049.1 TlpA family protein disulfide reductase [Thiomicrorhabdus sediminis]